MNDEILLYSARILAEKIRNREVASETVIKTYIIRIKDVNPILNAVVEDRFDLAIKEAKHVDQMLSKTNLSKEELAKQFPLLGIPLTIKESIAVGGLSYCAGKIFPVARKATNDADVIRLCRESGAIPLLVSNTPELCINFESYNKITGRTCNPYDTRRTSGGSSGGEAALLASGASLIGIGSDIFGSVRLPAHYCGIWGHKPSVNAVSVDGHYPSCKNQKNWEEVFCLGPMCRYAVDLPLLLNVILEENAKSLLQLNNEVHIHNIKIYYMEDDGGSILAHRIDNEIIFALRKLVSHLMSKYACKAQKIQIEEFKYSAELSFLKIFSIDDIETLYENNGEWAFAELLRYITFRSNAELPPILVAILKNMSGFLPKSVIPQCNAILSQFRLKLCQILGENGVLLYPCHPTAAHMHGQMYGKIFDYSYMGIFNALGFPVTSCPLGLNSDGLPIGMQVIAAPNNDRLTLAVAQKIEQSFGGWIPPPFSNPKIRC